MQQYYMRNGVAMDPPLAIIGNVERKERETNLFYYFIWDHDTPLGQKIDIEKIWIVLTPNGDINDIFYYSHYTKTSFLSVLNILRRDLPERWYLAFRPGTHTPRLLEGDAYSGYAVLPFQFGHERSGGEIHFYKSRFSINGVHGWRFPEIWLPMWVCNYHDLVQNQQGECQFVDIDYEDFLTAERTRKQISAYSLLDYSCCKQYNPADRPINDSHLTYPP